MPNLDMDKILNSSPEKRFLIACNNMKANYNESTADAFRQVYVDMPLKFILEHVDDIIIDAYFGIPFLEKVLNSNDSMFPVCDSIYESVTGFIDKHGSDMPSNQKAVYESFRDKLANIMDAHKHSIFILEYAYDLYPNDKERVINIVDGMYRNDANDVIFELANLEASPAFITLAPYAINNANARQVDVILESHLDPYPTKYEPDNWKSYVESSIAVKSLSYDTAYLEAVYDMNSSETKEAIEHMIETKPSDYLKERMVETVSLDKLPTIGLTTESAVDLLFDNQYYYDITEDDNRYVSHMIESASEILSDAYQSITLFKTTFEKDLSEDFSTTLTESTINSILEGSADFFNEASSGSDADDDDDWDVDVDDDEDEDTNQNKKYSSNTPNKQQTSNPSNNEVYSDGGSRVKKPEAKSLTQKIQFKAQDMEAKNAQKRAKRAESMKHIKLAGRAVLASPRHFVDNIKRTVRKIDKMDDDRRKANMIQPGQRNKVFHKLKIALLYGGTAAANIALLPVLMYARHLSKNKDRRIRKELEREIQTEIDVCTEKINDASSNGDQKEKYKLMRIKSKLEAELLRVKTNSKYV